MKYGFIREHANDYPVQLLCRQLGVQRSAYYDWHAQPGKVIAPEELALRRLMKALFAASRDSLGSRTMMKNLRAEGFEIGRDRTRRLMKRLGLKVRQKRKYKITTDSKHKLPVAQNVLDRQFSPAAPNQVWGTDITYLWTQQGWIYLAVVIDLYSRRVVGWAIDRRMKKALVIRALMMAVNLSMVNCTGAVTKVAGAARAGYSEAPEECRDSRIRVVSWAQFRTCVFW